MLQVGKQNTLKVARSVDFGMYLDGYGQDILLPKRYVPRDLKIDDEISVFVYHDNEGRLTATTDKPVAEVGDIAMMEAADITQHGAFLKWGIMKDVFIPISHMVSRMRPGGRYFVYLFIDEKTGRVTASEKIDRILSNNDLTVAVGDQVDMIVFQKTDIGYKTIINSKHLGVLHFNEVFRELEIGESIKGFVKFIRPDNKIDVALGTKGYEKVGGEEGRILELLQHNDGYLPYNDKSEPEAIYAFFGISKKTFKMTVGALYKKKLIELTQTGIKLISA